LHIHLPFGMNFNHSSAYACNKSCCTCMFANDVALHL